ncbi:bifunctional (p)ppGpp synthetase/guanosine-3',5'-bis(diphosphate) 3'-pyrophosphohydrolase [Sphingobacteriales bacterium UPWRP_1]|nr:RelA/SpoT family protein [Sphingobacteriales bacterium TSM_CSM]PSJ73744.1 bifunctional (p)ppGpp synthetase/guanosine-3',5'-bis(diphosphate) 3'-pyrophosphohydrolase [Sphingobacteriales bacterium UPWRP_1]
MVKASAYSEEEVADIKAKYHEMITFCGVLSEYDRKRLDSAFELALIQHEGTRRKSGEPYIYHPIAVARIVAEEIGGLDVTSIICALLHDVVEDTPITLEYIEKHFSHSVAKIIDGLTKITGFFEKRNLANKTAENLRKLLLTLGEDIRVILIKLADRLHNMRTLNSMPENKQLTIASETLFLYAPLAHRLGLYRIKSELEDLAMKYTEKDLYKEIATKLQNTKKVREEYIAAFIAPIVERLPKIGITKFRVFGRPKHIYSIANKIKHKEVPFEEIYDLFAIRIILDLPSQADEKSICWNVYAMVSDLYNPNPDRLRDWIASPRSNGYESLHTTVMGPNGKWVEVQIRSERMDAIAEKGIAAHWKYKGGKSEGKYEKWLEKVRELLSEKSENAVEWLNSFRHELYESEIFVYTPKGEMKFLPVGASVLDFAFEIHTDLGCSCIGAKIDGKLQPISYKLKNGDQIEVLTNKKQNPSEQWLNFTVTGRARSKIKSFLQNERRIVAEAGKEMLERKLRALKLNYSQNVINELVNYFRFSDSLDFFYAIATEAFDLAELKNIKFNGEEIDYTQKGKKPTPIDDGEIQLKGDEIAASDISIFGGFADRVDFSIANCCKPVSGDEVFGFVTIGKGIRIHRTDCPNARQLITEYPYRVVSVKWGKSASDPLFLASLRINGIDDIGLVNKITNIISGELKVNMRSISLNARDGIFEGEIHVFVKDNTQLKQLIKKLREVEGVYSVTRIN